MSLEGAERMESGHCFCFSVPSPWCVTMAETRSFFLEVRWAPTGPGHAAYSFRMVIAPPGCWLLRIPPLISVSMVHVLISS